MNTFLVDSGDPFYCIGSALVQEHGIKVFIFDLARELILISVDSETTGSGIETSNWVLGLAKQIFMNQYGSPHHVVWRIAMSEYVARFFVISTDRNRLRGVPTGCHGYTIPGELIA